MQKLYGGGYGFETITINGNEYLYPDMATDETWGDKYEGQEIVSWYDLAKWEAGGKVGNPTTSKWQTPANDIDSFFENWYRGVFEDAYLLYQHQKSWRRRFCAKIDQFVGVRNILHQSLLQKIFDDLKFLSKCMRSVKKIQCELEPFH